MAKLCSYGGWRKMEVFFTGAFLVCWIPMRIVLYFYKVLYSAMVDGYDLVRTNPWAWLCFAGLCVIYSLQFFWTKYLLEMVFTKLLRGKGVVDVRSDDEGEHSKKAR